MTLGFIKVIQNCSQIEDLMHSKMHHNYIIIIFNVYIYII